MTLEERINQDLKEAMKAQDKGALRAIRGIKSAITLVKTDGSGQALDAEREIQLLQKLVKQRQDSLDIYKTQGREDLAVIEEEEIEVIKRYLPAQLGDEELAAAIREIIAETGSTGMKDMGRVMGMAGQRLAGKAEGARIAGVVKTLLTSS